MMNEFLQQGGQLPRATNESFMMDPMQHIPQLMPGRTGSPGEAQAGWAREYGPGLDEQARMEAVFQAPKGAAFSAADFARFQQMNQPASARSASPLAFQAPTMNGYQGYQRPIMGIGMGMVGMGMHAPMYQQQNQFQDSASLQQADK